MYGFIKCNSFCSYDYLYYFYQPNQNVGPEARCIRLILWPAQQLFESFHFAGWVGVGTRSNRDQAQGKKGCVFSLFIHRPPPPNGGRITSLYSLTLVWEMTGVALLGLTQEW